MNETIRSRGLGVAAVIGIALFWGGVVVAGARLDGYSARNDYISSLASRGSPVAVLAVCALLASAAAHLATAGAALNGWRSWTCAGFLLGAAVSATVVALFRTSCSAGNPGCSPTATATGDWVDAVHVGGVVVYELFVVATMLTAALGAARRRWWCPRWLGMVSIACAVGSVLLLAQTRGGDSVGAWQRGWLVTNHAWLLLAAGAATRNRSPLEAAMTSQPQVAARLRTLRDKVGACFG